MISNATPLICLARIQQLELLKKLFTTIIIPKEVKEEILIDDKPGQYHLMNAFDAGFIHVLNPKKLILLGLGKGETAAISLAREKNDMILLDDATATRAANALNISTLRTTTVLFLAIQKEIITKKEALVLFNKLIENVYYISPRYYDIIVEKLHAQT